MLTFSSEVLGEPGKLISHPAVWERGLAEIEARTCLWCWTVASAVSYWRKTVDAMGVTGRFQIKVSVKDVTESLCIHFIRLNKYPQRANGLPALLTFKVIRENFLMPESSNTEEWNTGRSRN